VKQRHLYTLAPCALAAGAVALEIASLRSGDPENTLTAHTQTLFDRNHLTRGVLMAAAAWWVIHVIEPWGTDEPRGRPQRGPAVGHVDDGPGVEA
jgi:hypothetical protein